MILKNIPIAADIRAVLEPLNPVDVELLFQIFLHHPHSDWLYWCVKYQVEIQAYLDSPSQNRGNLLETMPSRRSAVVVAYTAALYLNCLNNLDRELWQADLHADDVPTMANALAQVRVLAAMVQALQPKELWWPFVHRNPWQCRKEALNKNVSQLEEAPFRY